MGNWDAQESVQYVKKNRLLLTYLSRVTQSKVLFNISQAFCTKWVNLPGERVSDAVVGGIQALGHTFEVQANLATPHGTKRPDYILTEDKIDLVEKSTKYPYGEV